MSKMQHPSQQRDSKPTPRPMNAIERGHLNMEVQGIWDELHRIVSIRLIAGAEAYGDESLNRPPLETIKEIEAEIADIFGWTVVLLVRLRRMEKDLAALLEKAAHGTAATESATGSAG